MSDIKIITTKAAERSLSKLEAALDVQMELLFSCLLRKRVLFRIPKGVKAYPMTHDNDRINLCFRPVLTKVCLVSDVEDVPDLEDFSIQRAEAFIPRWLMLDYRNGQWKGDFGWLGVEHM